MGAWARAATGWHEARRLKIARFGDNMRQVAVTEGDKVEAQARLGFAVNGYGVNELVERVAAVGDAAIDDLVDAYDDAYDVAAPLRRGGDRHAELRTAARIEAGLRSFLEDGGFGAFTDTFEDLGGLEQLPGIGVQRLMADGYGFGAEGDWKAAALVRILKVDGRRAARRHVVHGGLHLPPGRSRPGGPRRAHARGLPVAERRPAVVRDPPALDRRQVRSGPARLRRRARARRSSSASPTWATGSGSSPARSTSSRPTRRCRSCPSPAPSGGRGPSLATAAEAWLTAGGPHHTALTSALGIEAIQDFADIADIELVTIDASTKPYDFKRELRWNQAYYFLNRGP